MLTVGNDAGRVERMLEEGSLSCPGCGGRLAGWGHGRQRVVFGLGRRTRPAIAMDHLLDMRTAGNVEIELR